MKWPKMQNQYRVVAKNSDWYSAQVKRWWFPIWTNCFFSEEYPTEKHAKADCKRHAIGSIKYTYNPVTMDFDKL